MKALAAWVTKALRVKEAIPDQQGKHLHSNKTRGKTILLPDLNTNYTSKLNSTSSLEGNSLLLRQKVRFFKVTGSNLGLTTESLCHSRKICKIHSVFIYASHQGEVSVSKKQNKKALS